MGRILSFIKDLIGVVADLLPLACVVALLFLIIKHAIIIRKEKQRFGFEEFLLTMAAVLKDVIAFFKGVVKALMWAGNKVVEGQKKKLEEEKNDEMGSSSDLRGQQGF